MHFLANSHKIAWFASAFNLALMFMVCLPFSRVRLFSVRFSILMLSHLSTCLSASCLLQLSFIFSERRTVSIEQWLLAICRRRISPATPCVDAVLRHPAVAICMFALAVHWSGRADSVCSQANLPGECPVREGTVAIRLVSRGRHTHSEAETPASGQRHTERDRDRDRDKGSGEVREGNTHTDTETERKRKRNAMGRTGNSEHE